MKLACEGCDWSTERETGDELYAAMMAHGEEAHSEMFEGKSPEDLAAMKDNDGRPRPSDDHRPKLMLRLQSQAGTRASVRLLALRGGAIRTLGCEQHR